MYSLFCSSQQPGNIAETEFSFYMRFWGTFLFMVIGLWTDISGSWKQISVSKNNKMSWYVLNDISNWGMTQKFLHISVTEWAHWIFSVVTLLTFEELVLHYNVHYSWPFLVHFQLSSLYICLIRGNYHFKSYFFGNKILVKSVVSTVCVCVCTHVLPRGWGGHLCLIHRQFGVHWT
jgi:hypothetical protein